MAQIEIKNLNFKYPMRKAAALGDINLSIKPGEFVLICGKSGCGKSTLLRQMKPLLSPYGERSGGVYYDGTDAAQLSRREQAEQIGFVMQNPENGIVCDKVWHELAFGLESLGAPQNEISARVAEMASFFGIQNYFYKDVKDLSGGQKQLLNLAAVMTLRPSVLILDEPTSCLDPIAAYDFCRTLERINREFGTTVIISEHRLEEILPISDTVVVMERGRISAVDSPEKIGSRLLKSKNDMFGAMPSAIRIFCSVCKEDNQNRTAPVTIKEAREWLSDELKKRDIKHIDTVLPQENDCAAAATAAEMKNIWFRYSRDGADVLKNLSLSVRKGEFYAVLGGNGAGKSTAMSVLCGLNRPYRGSIKIAKGLKTAALPQNPQLLFSHKTVILCLIDAAKTVISSKDCLNKDEFEAEVHKRVDDVIKFCEIEELTEHHPYDLSGGEQQRAALAAVLITEPDILILDEATKGLDAGFKDKLAAMINKLCKSGKTVIAVSHDIEFCAKYADKCALLFDGRIVSQGEPYRFFGGKNFYTTAANRISRGMIDTAVLDADIVGALTAGDDIRQITYRDDKEDDNIISTNADVSDIEPPQTDEKEANNEKVYHMDSETPRKRISLRNIICGLICLAVFGAFQFVINKMQDNAASGFKYILSALGSVIALSGAFMSFFSGGKELSEELVTYREKGHSRRVILAAVSALVLVPLTILIGVYWFGDRKYYFISLLIILEIILPFIFTFEKRAPDMREIVIISVLCGIATAGRAAFAMLPQFKPVLAVVIISAACFGAETGFLVGAVSAFVSNFFFGQGPWTPWQMFAFGTVGFIAGIVFPRGIIRTTKINMCVYGFLSAIIIYGGIMNPSSVLIWQSKPNLSIFLSAYVMGFPFDLIHAASTVFFLWFGAEPICEKLDRAKRKYGLYK